MQPAQENAIKSSFDQFVEEVSTLKGATYHTLKNAILSGRLSDDITETQISEMLGVSRTPVREAMHQLETEGLLEISHGKKAHIRALTPKDIKDISVLLGYLYILSVALCIENVTDAQLDQMEETVGLISFYTARNDFSRLGMYNSRFHLQIAQASQNKWLIDITERLLSYTGIYREYAVSRPERAPEALKEHIEILEAIRLRNTQEAQALISRHVSAAFDVNKFIININAE